MKAEDKPHLINCLERYLISTGMGIKIMSMNEEEIGKLEL